MEKRLWSLYRDYTTSEQELLGKRTTKDSGNMRLFGYTLKNKQVMAKVNDVDPQTLTELYDVTTSAEETLNRNL